MRIKEEVNKVAIDDPKKKKEQVKQDKERKVRKPRIKVQTS